MGKVKILLSKLYRIGLLFLFLGYNASLTLFYHAHFYHGQVIFHSHPFKSDKNPSLPFEKHTHSQGDLAYLQELNNSLWEESPINEGGSGKISGTTILQENPTERVYVGTSPFISKLRAPPTVLF